MIEGFLQICGKGRQGDVLASDNADEEIHVRRHPYGVVVALTAWNYPVALAARNVGSGCEDGQYGFDGYMRKQTSYMNWASWSSKQLTGKARLAFSTITDVLYTR